MFRGPLLCDAVSIYRIQRRLVERLMKQSVRDSRCSGRDSKREPPRYKFRVERHYYTKVLGTASFLPHPYKFIIRNHPLYRRYTTYAAEEEYLSKPRWILFFIRTHKKTPAPSPLLWTCNRYWRLSEPEIKAAGEWNITTFHLKPKTGIYKALSPDPLMRDKRWILKFI